jgi:hypothetical protein
MRMTRGLLLFVLALTLALPAAAWAQSAGDEQYVDPFQSTPGGNNNGAGGGNGGGNNTGSNTSAGSGSAQGTTTGDTAGTTDTTSGGDGTALPRTGLPLRGVVVTGALLLGGGITLRRRV